MSTTLQIVPIPQVDEIREQAAYDVARYIRRHGLSLYDLVDLTGDSVALDAVEILIAEADKGLPDPTVFSHALDTVVECLSGLSFELLDELSRVSRGPADLLGAVNWHGGQTTDLLGRFNPS